MELGAIAASVQLVEQSIKCSSACIEFYKKFRDAPETARKQGASIDELTQIARSISRVKSLQTAEVSTALDGCQIVLDRITSLVDKTLHHDHDTKTRRFLKSFTGATSVEKVARCFVELDSTKTNLLLCIGINHADALENLVALHSNTLNDSQDNPNGQKEAKDVPASLYEVPSGRQVRNFVGRAVLLQNLERLLYYEVMERDAGKRMLQQRHLICNAFFSAHNSRDFTEDPAPDSTTRIVALRSLGGQGKTQVALRLCHRLRKKGLSHILWIDASSESSLRSAYVTYAHLMKPNRNHTDNAEHHVRYIKQELERRSTGFLLVMDNYDQPDTFENILDYVPDNAKGSVLVTSRHADAGALVTIPSEEDIELDGLGFSDAKDLLFQLSRVTRTTDDEDVAANIVQRLAYHPLAITQAAAFIKKSGRHMPLKNFEACYEEKKLEILRTVPSLSQYRRLLFEDAEETALSVFTTWELSFQQLTSDGKGFGSGSMAPNDDQHTANDTKRKLLVICSFLGKGTIGERLFAACEWSDPDGAHDDAQLIEWLNNFKATPSGWDHDRFGGALVSLLSLALVLHFEEMDGAFHFVLHPLIRDWLRLRYDPKTRMEYSRRALHLVGHALRKRYDGPSNSFHLQAAERQEMLNHIKAMVENRSDLGFARDHIRQDLSVLEEAVPQTSSGLQEFESADGRAKTITMQSLQIEDRSLQSSGNVSVRSTAPKLGYTGIPHAIMYWQTFCAIYCVSSHHPDLALRLVRPVGVTPEIIQFVNTLSVLDWDVVTNSLFLIAWALIQKSEYDLAEATARALVELYGTHKVHDDPERVYAWYLLGTTLAHQDKHAEAIEVYRHAVQQSTTSRGAEDRMTIASTGNLAMSLSLAGQHNEAEETFRRAQPVSRRVLGKYNAFTMDLETRMAHQLLAWGQVEEAVRMQREVVTNVSNVFGEGNQDTISVMKGLQLMLVAQGDVAEADEWASRIARLQQGVD